MRGRVSVKHYFVTPSAIESFRGFRGTVVDAFNRASARREQTSQCVNGPKSWPPVEAEHCMAELLEIVLTSNQNVRAQSVSCAAAPGEGAAAKHIMPSDLMSIS